MISVPLTCFNDVGRATNSSLKATLYKCLKFTHTPHICTLCLHTNTHHVRSCTLDMCTGILRKNAPIMCTSSHEQKSVTSFAHSWSLLPFLLCILSYCPQYRPWKGLTTDFRRKLHSQQLCHLLHLLLRLNERHKSYSKQ